MLQGKQLTKAICDYHKEGELQNLTKVTLSGRRRFLNRLLRFVGRQVFSEQVAKDYLQALRQEGWIPSSVNSETKRLRAFCSFCHRYGLIPINFSRNLVMARIRKKEFNLVAPEVMERVIEIGCKIKKTDNLLARRVKPDAEAALKFCLRTGLRISEVLSLRPDDFRLDDQIPNFTLTSKGGNRDILPIPKDMIPAIRQRLDQKKLFIASPEVLNRSLQRGAKEMKFKGYFHVHLLRHVFCTALLRRGVSLQIAQRLMRHRSVKITDSVYSHYLLIDLAGPINSQPIVRRQLTTAEVLSEVESSVKKVVGDDKRLEIRSTGKKIEVRILP